MRPIAIIPARGGSRRIPGKNIKFLGGKPLIGWTVDAARESGLFSRIICSTDSMIIADVARRCGAEVPFLRPAEYADGSKTYEWLIHAVGRLAFDGAIVILYPTNPFRSAETIRRAWRCYTEALADSLITIRPVQEHPGKMWIWHPGRRYMQPYRGETGYGARDYNRPTQDLRPVLHVQCANIRISNTSTLERYGNETGKHIAGFVLDDPVEALDINEPMDFLFARWIVESGRMTGIPDGRNRADADKTAAVQDDAGFRHREMAGRDLLDEGAGDARLDR